MEIVKFKPSHWVNFLWYITVCFFIPAAYFSGNLLWLIPIVIPIWKAIELTCWSYEIPIEGEYVIETKGVFSQTRVEVHCFRIKSIQIVKPNLLFILFGLSNVVVKTSEPFKPTLTYYAISDATIPNCDGINDYLRDSSIYWRNVKGVKETDFHSF